MKKSKIFYGYWVLAACLLLMIISAGCGPMSFSFFVTSLEKYFGWSRTQIMTAFTIFFMCSAISAPFAGRLVHRFGGRKIVTTGALTACFGYILISQMDYLWQYYIGYVFIGIGVAVMGPVIMTLIVSNWFNRRRGMAIGIMSMGAGLAGIIFTPLVIVCLIPNIGWSNAYLTLAAITGGVSIPLALFIIRTKPADMGLLPDGEDASKIPGLDTVNTPSTQGVTFKDALATRSFWFLAVAIFLIHTHIGAMQNQIPHLEDLGFSSGVVASSMSIASIMSTTGTLIFGWLCDRIKVKYAGVIGVTLTGLSILLLMYINSNSPTWLVWIYGVCLGLGMGGWMPAMSLLTSHNFGLLAYGTIYGVLHFFQSVGAAIGPVMAGYFHDEYGSYQTAFLIIVIMVALGIPLVLATRRLKY